MKALNRLTHALALSVATLFLSVNFALAAGERPDAPDNLQGIIIGAEVTLTWDIPADDDTVRGYNVYVDNMYRSTVSAATYTGPVVEDTLTSFYVVAFDSAPRRFSPASAELVLPESLIPTDLTIPPSQPLDLSGEIVDGQITIQWSPSTDDEAVLGYNVYRDNQYLATVADTSYSTDNAADESHNWYVVAFDIRRNFSQDSDSIRLPDTGPVDTTIPPSVATQLEGQVTTGAISDTVLLNWVASTDDQAVAGYNIYMNSDYTATVFDTEYEAQVPTGTSNTFKVVAFDFDGNFSLSSESITLPPGTEPTDPGVAPSIPTGLSISSTTANGQTTVTLEWEPSTSTVPVKGYNINRDDSYWRTVIGSTTFIDTLPVGTTATYSVVAFDDFQNYSRKSQPISILGAINQPPFFTNLSDQLLIVDEPWELVLAPVDVDDDESGILVSTLPTGMLLTDNLDGTSTLSWEPGISDVGEYDIEVTAVDLLDTDVRSTQNLKVTVTAEDIEQPLTPYALLIDASSLNLIEGDETGVSIAVSIEREPGFDEAISLSVQTQTPADAEQLVTLFSIDTLDAESNSSELNVRLNIGNLPLLPEQRRLIITASTPEFNVEESVTLAVTPVARDDVYLLIGQSNMVGYSEPGAKLARAGEPDETNARIIQPNVTPNNLTLITDSPIQDNVFDLGVSRFVPAEDPFHTPIDPESGLKAGNRIGMGLSFAKAALPNTTRNIVLVPAAWPGSAFCNTRVPGAHWNPDTTDNIELGNTLLFDRALQRVNETLMQSGGILRGILWHQGESDSNRRCAPFYEDNLVNLVQALRTRILPDARGEDARSPTADIPFVVGTMSKGQDEDSDYSIFYVFKRLVDGVHRNINSLVPYSSFTNNDDLIPENGYPCGNGSCIHFGSSALREMGVRTYESLLRAAED